MVRLDFQNALEGTVQPWDKREDPGMVKNVKQRTDSLAS